MQLPLRIRLRQFCFTLFCLTVFICICWATLAGAQQAPAGGEGMCTLLGVEGGGANQQIQVYTEPSFDHTDGSYGLPEDEVVFLEYVNATTRGEEWFKVRFPESEYEGWIIRYHISCPDNLWQENLVTRIFKGIETFLAIPLDRHLEVA